MNEEQIGSSVQIVVVRGWKGNLLYWLHVATYAAWLAAGAAACGMMIRWGHWAWVSGQ